MKTLFHPFFSRSSSADGQNQEKMPSRQKTTRHRGTDKSAQPAAMQRSTARTPAFSSQPHKPQNQTHHQQQPCPDATSSSHADQDPGLFDRIIRRGTTARKTNGGGRDEKRDDATSKSQLTTVPDEGYEEGEGAVGAARGHAAPSCSEIAPLDHHSRGQNPDDYPSASSSQQKTHNRFSRPHRAGNNHNNMAALTLQQQQSTKLRNRTSFRERFWTAHPANDFGDNNYEPATSLKSPTKSTHDAFPAVPEEEPAPAKPKAYVPRHAAADFSSTTTSSYHRRHSSWDGSRNSMHAAAPKHHQAGMSPSALNQVNHMLDSRVVAEEENPFADSNEADADGLSEMGSSSRRQKRLSAPPMVNRDSVAEFGSGPEDWPPSDYERFLEHARADERAQRIQVARRSWREGSKRDSAYYSGKKGSPRTSEEGSRRRSGSGRDVPPLSPRELTAVADAKRQSRVAQKIVEYIKPPRDDAARMSSVQEA